MQKTSFSSVIRFGSLFALAACGSAEGDPTDEFGEQEDALGSTHQAIIAAPALPLDNTTLATNMVLPGGGTVPGCSAVALDSEWILSAEHCFPPYSTPGVSGVGSQWQLAQPTEQKTVREISFHPGTDTSGVNPPRWADAALVRVYPFSSTSLRTLRLWNADITQLVGTSLTCIGQGVNSFAGGGSGTWRQAQMTVDSVGYYNAAFMLLPNSSGQIPWSGDSGGPCLKLGGDGVWSVVGTLSTVNYVGDTQNDWYTAYETANTGWVEDYRKRSRIIFHGAGGLLANGALERNATYSGGGAQSGFSTWSSVTVLTNGAVLLYNSANGAWGAGRVSKNGDYTTLWTTGSPSAPLYNLPTGVTHVTAVGDRFIFLYRQSDGTGWVLRLGADGSPLLFSAINGFATNWTHVVGTAHGGLFFYKSSNGAAVTARVDSAGSYAMVSSLTGFFTPWARITHVNRRGLLFYASNGVWCTGELTDSFAWQNFICSNNLPTGLISVVGGSNGGALLLGASGSGATVSISETGQLTFTGLPLSGFSTSWTSITAE